MARVTRLARLHDTLLEPGPGVDGIERMKGSDDGFRVMAGRNVKDAGVIVIDDTWTTGATAQSAACALTRAGAHVVAIVPVGRLITTKPDYEESEWWREQQAQPFEFRVCCVE
jgi:adenine/guanine phosphoribosyltransferase-like PRPP-binding protein